MSTALLINDLEGSCKAFSAACYDTNSIYELEQALNDSYQAETSCSDWSISKEEYKTAISAAINELLA